VAVRVALLIDGLPAGLCVDQEDAELLGDAGAKQTPMELRPSRHQAASAT
jgi:hypothetical protein